MNSSDKPASGVNWKTVIASVSAALVAMATVAGLLFALHLAVTKYLDLQQTVVVGRIDSVENNTNTRLDALNLRFDDANSKSRELEVRISGFLEEMRRSLTEFERRLDVIQNNQARLSGAIDKPGHRSD